MMAYLDHYDSCDSCNHHLSNCICQCTECEMGRDDCTCDDPEFWTEEYYFGEDDA